MKRFKSSTLQSKRRHRLEAAIGTTRDGEARRQALTGSPSRLGAGHCRNAAQEWPVRATHIGRATAPENKGKEVELEVKASWPGA